MPACGDIDQVALVERGARRPRGIGAAGAVAAVLAVLLVATRDGSEEPATPRAGAPTTTTLLWARAETPSQPPRAAFAPLEVVPGESVSFVLTGFSAEHDPGFRPDHGAVLARDVGACEFVVPFEVEHVVLDPATGTIRGSGRVGTTGGCAGVPKLAGTTIAGVYDVSFGCRACRVGTLTVRSDR